MQQIYAKYKLIINRIVITAISLIAAVIAKLLVEINELWWLIVFVPIFILIGYDIMSKAVKNISKGKVFDENFLMLIATIGAFVIGEYADGIFVMLFYQVGELFQKIAINNSRDSINKALDIRPDYANKIVDNKEVIVDPFELVVGDIIVIKAGERVATDGIVIKGNTTLDTSAITGESLPREIQEGDTILSGCINLGGTITAKVEKQFSQSTASKIVELIENASSNKSSKENFIAKFAKYYTPLVVIIAIILAVVPPLIIGDASWMEWLNRSITFLVVSCPCALVISIPLGFFAGIGKASKQGILFKGSNFLEAMSNVEYVVFDKTGTLTQGKFEVQEIVAIDYDEHKLLEISAHVESYSNHPLSRAVVDKYGQNIDINKVSKVQEISGKGIIAMYDDLQVIVGNLALMQANNITVDIQLLESTTIYVAINNKIAGYIVLADSIKKDSINAIKALKSVGVKQCIMLSGDNVAVANKIAQQLSLDKAYGGLLPNEKVIKLEEIISQKSPKKNVVFVGDGINDAPVLARADVGIAMGGVGSDIAIETADVVLMTDEPSKIEKAIKISRFTLKIVKINIIFCLFVKFVTLLLSSLGLVSMWLAVFADVGVSVIAILNSMRILSNKKLDK